VFEFPPKVNWATHPTKRDHSDAGTPSADSKASSAPPRVPPPRPPKKSVVNPASIAVTVSSPQPSSTEVNSKSVGGATEVDETHDSSSTCSSLHSPPGSAGVVYCNTADLLDAKNARLAANSQVPSLSSKSNQSPSTTDMDTPPPVVDRNLKPLRRDTTKSADTNFRSTASSRFSPSQKLPTPSYSSGTMTLPSRHVQNNRPGFVSGPVIDRTRKPFDASGPLTLGPTPAQMKSQSRVPENWSSVSIGGRGNVGTGTLPSSLHRRAGPVISPSDKRPVIYHEYEQARELQGQYLKIYLPSTKGTDSPKPNPIVKKNQPADGGGSVEYLVIDPVMTQALKTTREERERKLRNNSVTKLT
jgi:hypothetical protein